MPAVAGRVENVTVSAVAVAAEAMLAAQSKKATWPPLTGGPPMLAVTTASPSPLAPQSRC